MPTIEAAGLTLNYDEQGAGDPLLLIPYTGADHACYAFQLPAYTEHFRCISVDLPGSGESSKPAGPYSTESYADQMAAFLDAIEVERAHVAGVSLGRRSARIWRPGTPSGSGRCPSTARGPPRTRS